jgi:hypothetical protein
VVGGCFCRALVCTIVKKRKHPFATRTVRSSTLVLVAGVFQTKAKIPNCVVLESLEVEQVLFGLLMFIRFRVHEDKYERGVRVWYIPRIIKNKNSRSRLLRTSNPVIPELPKYPSQQEKQETQIHIKDNTKPTHALPYSLHSIRMDMLDKTQDMLNDSSACVEESVSSRGKWFLVWRYHTVGNGIRGVSDEVFAVCEDVVMLEVQPEEDAPSNLTTIIEPEHISRIPRLLIY